ncbi:MAG TPA: T9SS type A sorting domain-containing protein [Bacteroidetes bacterium]|nr:T9SS type A sorting domain-containing protein [Bacteroidota bacterium]
MKRWPEIVVYAAVFGVVAAAVAGQPIPTGPRSWVFFTDKGSRALRKAGLERVEQELPQRTLWRRSKVLPEDRLVDETDLPVPESYVRAVQDAGATVVVRSCWLNAISVVAERAVLERISHFLFVRKIQPVARAAPHLPQPAAPPGLQKPTRETGLSYGPSFTQLALMRVPELHQWGVTGAGVVIGMLDAGYDWRSHEAFQHVKVLGEHDFIWDDDITYDQEGQDYPGQDDHGTMTFSTIAGFMPGQLIGPAFDAAFYLAKTERVTDLQGHDFEKPIEEDYWVAGLEWLERNGVDLVSSSLGYLDWYTPQDMDGNTAVVTVAADLAAKKGVLVINSAGNEGNHTWQKIIAPADGDSVVAVGAINADGTIASFSSLGPTADGRIKPDVVALGNGVYVASPNGFSQYSYVRGTSFSCPLVAGVAALVLSAHPWLTPMQLRDALRETADRAASPDTVYGWGLVDAVKAALYDGPVFSNLPLVVERPDGGLDVLIYAVPKGAFLPGSLVLHYSVMNGDFQDTGMALGDTAHQYVAHLPAFPAGTLLMFRFSAVDSAVGTVEHPYAPEEAFRYVVGQSGVTGPWEAPPEATVLHHPYPNPFRTVTRVSFDLNAPAEVCLKLYNVRGRLVRTLVNGVSLPAGRYGFDWAADDDAGRHVAAGVYIARLTVGGRQYTEKLLHLH